MARTKQTAYRLWQAKLRASNWQPRRQLVLRSAKSVVIRRPRIPAPKVPFQRLVREVAQQHRTTIASNLRLFLLCKKRLRLSDCSLRRHESVRDPRKAGDNHAEGYAAGSSDPW
uniref:Integron gene cassette protein n=1 Tax=Ditylenchus dipsaci TaxID=166011 RepID=A0A915DY16_9BILA